MEFASSSAIETSNRLLEVNFADFLRHAMVSWRSTIGKGPTIEFSVFIQYIMHLG
jgi:hypothetical protein